MPRPAPPLSRTATILLSAISTSPPTNVPSTSAASTPSLTRPVYDRRGDWSIPLLVYLSSLRSVYTIARRRMAEITLERVGKAFADTVAVDDVSLEIADGEFLVLVGPSGCGKSTLLRMIAGLEEPTGGRISIGGRDVTDLSPRDRDVAMVFQNYALYPHMTVERNLGYGLRARRVAKEEIARRVAEVAQMLGLDDFLARKPAALSGGQRQRVAMGRAIVREPT